MNDIETHKTDAYEIPRENTETIWRSNENSTTKDSYKTDNKWFGELEINREYKTKHINGKLASNMYLEAKRDMILHLHIS